MNTHSPETLALLRRTVTQNLTDDQHALFVRAHEQTGLDPFGRFLYVARERGKFRIESTIDGFRLTAERTGKYAGQIGPHWCGADGAWKSIWTSKEPPVAARVGILRGDFQKPIWGKALYSEFVQIENGKPTEFWSKMAANQLAKCAEAAGFRKAFPERFSGLYTSDEMAQANSGVSEAASHRTAPAQLTLVNGGSGANPDHGGDSDNPSDPAVPLPLQGFIQSDGTVGDRRNVESCFRFLEGELEAALGEPGRELFRSIHWKLPRVFKSKQALNDATLQCWFELWAEVEKAKALKVAA
jgi:phage recombination protein Bet